MALKIQDEFGIVTERKRQREVFAKQLQAHTDRWFANPSNRAQMDREVNKRLKAEVDAIIERRTREQMAEIARMQIPNGPPIGEVLVLVSDVTGAPVPDIIGPRRSRNLAWPRFLAVHILLAVRPDLSLPAIGKALGGRDHTSIMHARDKFRTRMEVEPVCRWLADARVQAMLDKRPRLAEAA